MTKKVRRRYGRPMGFEAMGCEPVNELGVVYLFGALHRAFDFKVHSMQPGFPDCIARRQIKRDRWEEIQIELEFNSRSFVSHGHDPDAVDMIVCWNHNWKDCPEHIEVVELKELIGTVSAIAKEVEQPKRLTAWQRFCREKRLEGLAFGEIAELWRGGGKQAAQKAGGALTAERARIKKPTKTKRPLTDYQRFCQEQRNKGVSMAEAAKLWRKRKANRS